MNLFVVYCLAPILEFAGIPIRILQTYIRVELITLFSLKLVKKLESMKIFTIHVPCKLKNFCIQNIYTSMTCFFTLHPEMKQLECI